MTAILHCYNFRTAKFQLTYKLEYLMYKYRHIQQLHESEKGCFTFLKQQLLMTKSFHRCKLSLKTTEEQEQIKAYWVSERRRLLLLTAREMKYQVPIAAMDVSFAPQKQHKCSCKGHLYFDEQDAQR